MYVHDLDLFVTVQLLEETLVVLSLGKLCEDFGFSKVSAIKNHDDQRVDDNFAKRTISYRFVFPVCPPILVAIRLHHRQCRICLQQVQSRSEVTDHAEETGADLSQNSKPN